MEEFNIGYTLSGLVVNTKALVRYAVIDFALLFKKEDPAVVTIILKYGQQVGRWEVSRDYMVKGIMYSVPAGEGDFRVEPFIIPPEFADIVQVQSALFTFHSKDETGTRYSTEVLVRHDLVKQFIEKTIELAPRSLESTTYDIDDVIRRLLES